MKKLISTLCIVFVAFLAMPAYAQIAGEEGLLTGLSSGCLDSGNCELCDIISIVNNVIVFALGITGGLALLAFVIAGLYLMFAQGESGKIAKGFQTLKLAAIGLVLIFFSYAIVNFALNTIVGADVDGVASLFSDQPWGNLCGQEAPEVLPDQGGGPLQLTNPAFEGFTQ
jgi:hypothetical protein